MAMLIYLNAQCSGECTICGIRAQSHNTSIAFSLKSMSTFTFSLLSSSSSSSSPPSNDAYKRAKSIYKINGWWMHGPAAAGKICQADGWPPHRALCLVIIARCEAHTRHSFTIQLNVFLKVFTQRMSPIRWCTPPPHSFSISLSSLI